MQSSGGYPRWDIRVFRKEMERGADERAGVRKLIRGMLERIIQRDAFGTCHQQAEGDGLRVAVGKALIGRIREEELAPVLCETGESRTFALELFYGLIAEEPAEARRRVRELFCG